MCPNRAGVRRDGVSAPFHIPCPPIYQTSGRGAWDRRRQTAPRTRCRDRFADQNIWARARTALLPPPLPQAPPFSPHHLVLSLALPAEGQIALGEPRTKALELCKMGQKKKKKKEGLGLLKCRVTCGKWGSTTSSCPIDPPETSTQAGKSGLEAGEAHPADDGLSGRAEDVGFVEDIEHGPLVQRLQVAPGGQRAAGLGGGDEDKDTKRAIWAARCPTCASPASSAAWPWSAGSRAPASTRSTLRGGGRGAGVTPGGVSGTTQGASGGVRLWCCVPQAGHRASVYFLGLFAIQGHPAPSPWRAILPMRKGRGKAEGQASSVLGK